MSFNLLFVFGDVRATYHLLPKQASLVHIENLLASVAAFLENFCSSAGKALFAAILLDAASPITLRF